MKVRTLIALLSGVDPDLDVVISTDPEGNGFYRLSTIDDLHYVEAPVDRWYHDDIYSHADLTEAECDTDEDEAEDYDPLDGYEKVLILWA